MKLILDASVAFKLAIDEADSEKARQASASTTWRPVSLLPLGGKGAAGDVHFKERFQSPLCWRSRKTAEERAQEA